MNKTVKTLLIILACLIAVAFIAKMVIGVVSAKMLINTGLGMMNWAASNMAA